MCVRCTKIVLKERNLSPHYYKNHKAVEVEYKIYCNKSKYACASLNFDENKWFGYEW
jgi:hypothetical protein